MRAKQFIVEYSREKTSIRQELTDDLGDEARVAFEWAIKIMKDLGGEQ